MSEIPKLSHLQFLVAGILRGRAMPGRVLRDELEARGVRRGGPAFYQMMARMEDVGLVSGTYHQEIIEGQIIRERHYELTAEGLRAWNTSRDFYLSTIRGFEGREGLADA